MSARRHSFQSSIPAPRPKAGMRWPTALCLGKAAGALAETVPSMVLDSSAVVLAVQKLLLLHVVSVLGSTTALQRRLLSGSWAERWHLVARASLSPPCARLAVLLSQREASPELCICTKGIEVSWTNLKGGSPVTAMMSDGSTAHAPSMLPLRPRTVPASLQRWIKPVLLEEDLTISTSCRHCWPVLLRLQVLVCLDGLAGPDPVSTAAAIVLAPLLASESSYSSPLMHCSPSISVR